MSSDLLKEFGSPQESLRNQLPGQSITNGTTAEEEDFGDFEGPESVERITGRLDDGQPQTSLVEEVTDPADNDEDWGDFTDNADQSVFFDADQELKTQNGHTKQLQVKQQGAKKFLKVSLAPIPLAKAPSTPVSDQFESESSVNISQSPIVPAKAIIPTATAKVAPKPSVTAAKAVDLGPPPTNIPPPSVLLPLVATLFQCMSTNVKKAATSERASSDPYEPLDQTRTQQIQETLADARAGARIMAGRKLRWKRDNILSQSMKIGPASGKVSGMKLAGVDKAETRREDQEAAEALRAWKQHVGLLRSTISMINVHLPGGGLSIPDIAEAMPIRVVKPSEGAVTAPKCCFVCGIKRDERVAKVDVDVEDSFDEWWREYWGHVDCVAFWENHKASLRQR
ncbi:hypothetical protein OEA41_007406 [Lepraria neglecta]|uniref:Uncharacterized protein n=1 Tax=Lepraria neglecta TaxID=209136 RepID=A0AAE0DN14_9LECA|nr:hypothetical protein OEA41_007406 [Lepraria neglecta]